MIYLSRLLFTKTNSYIRLHCNMKTHKLKSQSLVLYNHILYKFVITCLKYYIDQHCLIMFYFNDAYECLPLTHLTSYHWYRGQHPAGECWLPLLQYEVMTLGYKGEGKAWGLLVRQCYITSFVSFPAVIKPITLHDSQQQTQWML